MSSGLPTPILCQDCGKQKPHKARGLCNACYRRWWAKENPEASREIGRRKHARHCEANNERKRAYYAENRERLLAQQKARDALRIEDKRAYMREYGRSHQKPEYLRAYRLRTRYGLSVADYDALMVKQKGVCVICEQPEKAKTKTGTMPLRVDHDHLTGKVRGLLCSTCNTAVGYLDRADWLKVALAYIAVSP